MRPRARFIELAAPHGTIPMGHNGACPCEIAAVLSHPDRDWRAAELAKLAGISDTGLRALFRQSQYECFRYFSSVPDWIRTGFF